MHGDGHGGTDLVLTPIGSLWSEIKYPTQPTTGIYLNGPGISPDPFEGLVGFSYTQIANYDPVQ